MEGEASKRIVELEKIGVVYLVFDIHGRHKLWQNEKGNYLDYMNGETVKGRYLYSDKRKTLYWIGDKFEILSTEFSQDNEIKFFANEEGCIIYNITKGTYSKWKGNKCTHKNKKLKVREVLRL